MIGSLSSHRSPPISDFYSVESKARGTLTATRLIMLEMALIRGFLSYNFIRLACYRVDDLTEINRGVLALGGSLRNKRMANDSPRVDTSDGSGQ